MADFGISYRITVLGNEGGLNPGNGEAFTYRGIDESQNPKWPGFTYVHSVWESNKHLGLPAVNKLLTENEELQKDVQAFYLANYWNTHSIGKIHDQQVANNVFDCSVNPCIDTSSKALQKACNNVISSQHLVIHPLLVDGNIGPATIATVNELNPELLFNAINNVRAANYRERVRRTPVDQAWLNTWLNRLVLYKN
jgi:hypothetical protein